MNLPLITFFNTKTNESQSITFFKENETSTLSFYKYKDK